jgi:hypothetical protein
MCSGSKESVPLDEDDIELLNQLKTRIKMMEAEIHQEVGGDLDEFHRRLDGVVRSVKRIESMDLPTEDDLLYRGASTKSASLELETPTEPQYERMRRGVSDEDLETPQTMTSDHVQIVEETPYDTMERVEDIPLELTSYGMGLDTILENLIKLIRIKRSKNNIPEAWNLVSVALEISPENMDLQKEISILEGISQEKVRSRAKDEKPLPGPEEGRTKVLLPELEGEIVRIENRARTSIEQLEKLVSGGAIPKAKIDRYMNYLSEAKMLFSQKMFTKASDLSIGTINELKQIIKENMDNQIQENLDRAREMVESLEKGTISVDEEFRKNIRDRFDTALRSYLTDEFERANLLAMEVIRKVMELTHPESASIRLNIQNIRKKLRPMRDQPQLKDNILDLEDMIKRAEDLLNKRDIEDSTKVLKDAQRMLQDLELSEKLHSQASELHIKLSNRFQRLGTDSEIDEVSKKMDYLSSLMEKARFEDVIILGKDLESELDSIENSRKDRECKEMLSKLDDVLVHIEEMDNPRALKRENEEVRKLYMTGDLANTKARGKDLLDKLQKNLKILSITRAKRICSSIIDSKVNVSELRLLNIDTTDHERRIRKARTFIKDENYLEGLRLLDSINEEMRAKVSTERTHIKGFANVHRDSMEALMERYREEPLIVLMRKKQVPMAKRYLETGNFHKAVEAYEKLADRLDSINVRDEVRKRIESDLAKGRFDIYRKKDEGLDISEPLSIFAQAQKRFTEGRVILAEYMLEVSKKYCEDLLAA